MKKSKSKTAAAPDVYTSAYAAIIKCNLKVKFILLLKQLIVEVSSFHKNHSFELKIRAISRACGVCVSTVSVNIRQLCQEGFIVKEVNGSFAGQQTAIYKLSPKHRKK